MVASSLQEALSRLTADDIRVDSLGRVVITSPSVSDAVKGVGGIRPDDVMRNDTNIICCGNTTCAQGDDIRDLGVLVDRFTRGGMR